MLIAEGLSIMDADVDHVISGASVSIGNPQADDSISLDDASTGLVVQQESDASIMVTGEAMASTYQVHSTRNIPMC